MLSIRCDVLILVFWLALLKPINKTSLPLMRQRQGPVRFQERDQVDWSCDWAYDSGEKLSWTINCDVSNDTRKMTVFCVCLDILKESRTRNATVTTRLANLRLNSISLMFTQTLLYLLLLFAIVPISVHCFPSILLSLPSLRCTIV